MGEKRDKGKMRKVGVSERFRKLAENPAAVPGAPSVTSSVLAMIEQLQELLDAVVDSEIPATLAKLYRKMFDEFVAAGFTEEQALDIVKSQSFTN